MNLQIGKLVYIASPYSSPNKVTKELRFLTAVIATGFLMNHFQDTSFYSPIAHTHPVATHCDLPGNWEYWKQFDEVVLSRCQEIWVLCIDGWRTSTGVTAELGIAAEFGLPVKYIIPQANGEYVVADSVDEKSQTDRS